MIWFPKGWAPSACSGWVGSADLAQRAPEYHSAGMALLICNPRDLVCFSGDNK